MLIRCIVLFLLCCTACRSGIIPCPEVEGLRLKKSKVNKRFRAPRQMEEPVLTVSSDAKTLQPASKNSRKYKYVEYTMQHIDVEEMDCPKPGEKKMPRAVKENIRKNKKKIRHYYEEVAADSLAFILTTHSKMP